VVLWAAPFAAPLRIRARALDVAGPAVKRFHAPRRTVVGMRTAYSAKALDSWSEVRSYRWRFGDGDGARGRSVSHTFAEPGRYQVRLTITDAVGNKTVRSRTARVLPTPVTGARVTCNRQDAPRV
jgi:chitodextrinase